MAIPSGALAAAQKYGPLVNGVAAQYTNPVTGGKLSGTALLLKLSKGENNFQMGGAPSSAGARGATQFTPGSRQVAISKYGVDPWSSYDGAFHAAALHLLGKINGSTGLQGYNPGSSSYTGYILGQRVGATGGGTSGGASPPSAPSAALSSPSTPSQGSVPPSTAGSGLADLLSSLQQQRPVTQGMQLQAPATSSTAYLRSSGPGPMAANIQPQQSGGEVAQLLAALGQGGAPMPTQQPQSGQQAAGGSPLSQALTAPGATGSGQYVHPFPGSIVAPGRTDEGVDPTIKAGGKIAAIGNAKVVALQHNFYGTTPYLVYQLTDGPHAGKYIYVSEYFNPTVKPGQTVRAGQTIGTGTGRAIETGFAGGPKGSYLPLANRAQGGNYTEGKVTTAGQQFAHFLAQLGVKGYR